MEDDDDYIPDFLKEDSVVESPFSLDDMVMPSDYEWTHLNDDFSVEGILKLNKEGKNQGLNLTGNQMWALDKIKDNLYNWDNEPEFSDIFHKEFCKKYGISLSDLRTLERKGLIKLSKDDYYFKKRGYIVYPKPLMYLVYISNQDYPDWFIRGSKEMGLWKAESFEAKGYAPDKPFYATTHEIGTTTVMHPINCGHYKMVMNGTGVWDSPTFYDTIEEMFTDKFDEIMETQAEGMIDYLDTEIGQETKRKYQAIKTIGDARKFAKRNYDFKIDFAPCFRKERDYDSKALNALPITVAPIYDEDYFDAESKKMNPLEKAGISGMASGATMEGLETLMAAEDKREKANRLINKVLNMVIKDVWNHFQMNDDDTLDDYLESPPEMLYTDSTRTHLKYSKYIFVHSADWDVEYGHYDGDYEPGYFQPTYESNQRAIKLEEKLRAKYNTKAISINLENSYNRNHKYGVEVSYNAETLMAAEGQGFEYYFLVDDDGKVTNDFSSLEEAQIARSYVPHKNLKIMRRRFEGRNMTGKTTEVREFDPYSVPNYFKNNYHSEEEELSKEQLSAYFARLKNQNPDLAKEIEYSVKEQSYLPRVDINKAGFDDDIIEAWVDLVAVEDDKYAPFERCDECEGEGYVLTSYTSATRFEPADGDGEDCSYCEGTGEIDPAEYMYSNDDGKVGYLAETFEAPMKGAQPRRGRYEVALPLDKTHTSAIRKALKDNYKGFNFSVKMNGNTTVVINLKSGKQEIDDWDSMENGIIDLAIDTIWDMEKGDEHYVYFDTKDEMGIDVYCFLGAFGNKEYIVKNAETKLSKTSCCCGADEANPCVCMKAPEPMECSAKAPKCACYKALEKNAEFLYYYVLNEKGESPADFNTLEEAQTYVANSSEPLEIYERRSRDDEAYKMDKKMNAEYDEEDMVFCNHCSDIVGNEKEVYGDETVEYEMANGELVCVPCYKEWMEEYKNDLDPHYSPFYAENFEARDNSWCVNHGWIRGGTKIEDIIPCSNCNDMICDGCRCGGCGNCNTSDCCECSHNQAAESFIKSPYVWGAGIFALTFGILSRKR